MRSEPVATCHSPVLPQGKPLQGEDATTIGNLIGASAGERPRGERVPHVQPRVIKTPRDFSSRASWSLELL